MGANLPLARSARSLNCCQPPIELIKLTDHLGNRKIVANALSVHAAEPLSERVVGDEGGQPIGQGGGIAGGYQEPVSPVGNDLSRAIEVVAHDWQTGEHCLRNDPREALAQ